MIEYIDYIINATSDAERELLTVQREQYNSLTCECGKSFFRSEMYRCLYCGIYRCQPCSEAHFGKTVEEYREPPKKLWERVWTRL